MIPLNPDRVYTGELTLEQVAAQARDRGVPWFTHPNHPGRVLVSSMGAQRETFCLHGARLDAGCWDCIRDLTHLYGQQQAAS